jgi:hypothetical protein
MNVKVGDELILHSSNGKDYPVKIVNINEYRPPEMKYAVDIYSEGTWYSDAMNDYYFCGDDLIEKCEMKKESVVMPKFYNDLAIIEPEDIIHSQSKYGNTYTIITPQDIEALKNGKILLIDDGEYGHFIKLGIEE